MQRENVSLHGYLLKQGGFRTNWKKRWFYTKGSILYYARGMRDDKKPLGSLKLCSKTTVCGSNASVKFDSADSTARERAQCLFHIVTPQRTFHLIAESAEKRHDWVRNVAKALTVFHPDGAQARLERASSNQTTHNSDDDDHKNNQQLPVSLRHSVADVRRGNDDDSQDNDHGDRAHVMLSRSTMLHASSSSSSSSSSDLNIASSSSTRTASVLKRLTGGGGASRDGSKRRTVNGAIEHGDVADLDDPKGGVLRGVVNKVKRANLVHGSAESPSTHLLEERLRAADARCAEQALQLDDFVKRLASLQEANRSKGTELKFVCEALEEIKGDVANKDALLRAQADQLRAAESNGSRRASMRRRDTADERLLRAHQAQAAHQEQNSFLSAELDRVKAELAALRAERSTETAQFSVEMAKLRRQYDKLMSERKFITSKFGLNLLDGKDADEFRSFQTVLSQLDGVKAENATLREAYFRSIAVATKMGFMESEQPFVNVDIDTLFASATEQSIAPTDFPRFIGTEIRKRQAQASSSHHQHHRRRSTTGGPSSSSSSSSSPSMSTPVVETLQLDLGELSD
jgi:PH domain